MSIRVFIASRTLSTWPTRPSGTAARICRALAMEAAAETALSRVVAISSTSCESAEAPAGSAACASRMSTNRRPMTSPSPTASSRSPGGRDDVVRAADVGRRGRECPGERDERIVREEALEAVEAPAGRGQVGVERVHRGPVDPQAGLPDPVDHRLEVGPQGARLVERRQVPEGSQGGARDDEEQDDSGDAAQHHPSPGP